MPKGQQKLAVKIQDKEQQQSLEMRRSKMVLFIQQVEKEAQVRINELESKLESMLVKVDKVFNVEMMKLPPLLQNTLMCDLTCGTTSSVLEDEVPTSEISIAVKTETRQIVQPLRRVPSKRTPAVTSPELEPVSPTIGPSMDVSTAVKSVDSSPFEVQSSSSKTQKGGKRTKKTRTLAGSYSAGNLIPSSTPLRSVQSCLNRKPPEQMAANQSSRKLRSVMSASDLPCSMTGSAAHVTVTTARGEMVSFSEETKDDINWDLLDDVAWCQIQKLSRLMDYLTQQSRCQR